MSYHRIFGLVGWLGMILTFAMATVWIFSLVAERETLPGVPAKWMFCVVCSLAASSLLILFGKGKKSSTLFPREAIAVAGLGWIYCSLCGSLPLMGMGGLDFFEAFFEVVSALTTTGATVFSDVEAIPPSLNLWRCMMQWIGGLGVVFLFVAVLGSGGRRLIHNESSRMSSDNLQPQIQKVALAYTGIYLALSVVCFSGYMALGMGSFNALCFSMTTCSTGGMAPVNDFLGVFNSVSLQVWCIVFMFFCSIAFPLHYHLWILRRWDVVKRDQELLVYISVLVLATTIISLNLIFEDNFQRNAQDVLAAAFQVVSIVTTTGYGSADFAMWPDFSQLILVVLMMIGGCAGSTAGGLKVSRIIIFGKAITNWLKSNFAPRSVRLVSYGNSSIPENVVASVVAYVGLYFSICVLGIIVLALLEANRDLITLVSTVISAFNNIGPALGELGPMSNFSELNDPALLWLSILMLMGRLEIVVLLALFMPSFWKKF
jgi:trk system potassium uptake protein TrkH